MAEQRSVIVSDPEILAGTPVFLGTRVPVDSLIDYLEGGDTLDEFLDNFPSVTREAAVVLLDENLPRSLAHTQHLPSHDCRTVVQCGWAGKGNGELLALAESVFDVLMTLDRSVPYQQRIAGRLIAVLIVRARSNRMADLLPVIPACMKALESIQSGSVVSVSL
jgi:uncharacterized protein (DUF433 family)